MFDATPIHDLLDDEEARGIRELDEWFHREIEDAIGFDDCQRVSSSAAFGCHLTGRLARSNSV